jgi:hypothetical protein
MSRSSNPVPYGVSSTELDLKLFIRSVACALNIDHSTVKRALLRNYEDPPGRGRHRKLSSEVEHALVEWIAKRAYDDKNINRTELLNYFTTNCGTAITRIWADSFMSCYAADLWK